MQRLDDRRLGRMIDLADVILRTLGGDRQQVEIARAARDDVAGAACRLDGRGEHRVHESGARGQVTEDRRSERHSGMRSRPLQSRHRARRATRVSECGTHHSTVRVCASVRGSTDVACDPTHREPSARDGEARLRRVRVVLVRPSLPANIGAAARAMLTMGLARLTLVAPARFPDDTATALASGATTVLEGAARRADAHGSARRNAAVDRVVGAAARIRRTRDAPARAQPPRRSAWRRAPMSRWCSAPKCPA